MSITDLLKPEIIISSLGLVGVVAIIFAESGLFFGFFFPGDSLLFSAGLFASMGILPIYLLLPLTFVAAVLGDQVGYWTGKKFGPAIFNRPDSIIFKQAYVKMAQEFYAKHGAKAIVLARFVPIVRTFAPIVAGVAQMSYSTFLRWNIIGGFLWTFGFIILGFVLGNIIPGIEKYVTYIALFIIFISILPGIFHIFILKKDK